MIKHKSYRKKSRGLYRFLIVLCAIVLIVAIAALYFGGPSEELEMVDRDKNEKSAVETGIDARTGFIEDEGMQAVINNCTTCHSAELVTQNKMTREGWLATIRWMQESQNLWDLGQNEGPILDYLAKNYAPEDTGRRPALGKIEWYDLPK